MTFDERVEKAMEAIGYCIPDNMIEDAIRAAFPDLYGEKPTAWIAPWEATERMCELGWGDVPKDWRAMRDDFLKDGG